MNSKVHPLFAAFVIVLSILMVAAWMWSSGQAKQFGGPARLAMDPSGHLYIQIQNILLEHDTDGRFIKRHDLSQLNVEHVLGAVRFFSNGDLLLRRGVDSRTLLDNIRAYMRLSNEKPLHPDLADTGIYRCNLQTHSCSIFGPKLIDFAAAFGLYIDPRTDDVYISDTTRHTLRKYSAQGESLGQAIDGFRFPNQLLIHDNRLYVADTNHHRIRIVEPGTESFGTEIASANVIPPEARKNKQNWPSQFAHIDDDWWVNNMRTNMEDGGIYIFDPNWVFKRKVDLPDGADPIAIAAFGEEVLITDWNNDRVHRVTTDGRLLGDFQSSGLEEVIAESVSLRWQYQSYAYLSVAAFFLIIVALVIKGIVNASYEKRPGKIESAEFRTNFPNEMLWIQPDAKAVRKILVVARSARICVVGLIPLLTYLILASDNPLLFLQIVPPIAGLVFLLFLVTRMNAANVKTAIGLCGDQITLRDQTGSDTTCAVKNIIYNQATIASPDRAVFLGQPPMPIYDRETLEAQVFPRLAAAKAVSAWEMQMTLIRMRHPLGVFALLLFVSILLGGTWILLKDAI